MDRAVSIDSPNNGQHEFFGADLLLRFFRGIISQYAPFRRRMTFQKESTIVPSHKSLKSVFLVSLENGPDLSASFHPNLSQSGR
jgi:hypothetical protein